MAKKTAGGLKIACENRKARHDYFIHETYEAGIELKGTEVKSLRSGRANLKDSLFNTCTSARSSTAIFSITIR